MRARLILVVAAACGGGEKRAEEPKPQIIANEPEQPTEAPPPTFPAVVGIPACDEYLARYKRCMEEASEDMGEFWKQEYERLVESWTLSPNAERAQRDAYDVGCAQAVNQARELYISICPGVWD